MAVLERVATLIRANLNELIERAEDPETMLKQVILDMENQLLQVKTQVAIAMADQHLLENKQKEQQDQAAGWMSKAERAVDRGQDDVARAALERYRTCGRVAGSYAHQIAEHRDQTAALRSALDKLDQKLSEARAKCDLLVAQHRRARAREAAGEARAKFGDGSQSARFDRLRDKVTQAEAVGRAREEVMAHDIDRRLDALETDDEVGRLLEALKTRRTS